MATNPWLRVTLLVIVALGIRLVVYPVNEYLAGDAVSRVELAERWAESPHVITSFGDGARQYGPLQLYLIGAALQWVDRNEAVKLINLVCGVLTVVPLFLVSRRYFGTPAATWSCLAFAAWGLHIQLSTTGGSEALALFLMWVAFAFLASTLDRPRLATVAGAAAAMNLAAAARYDAWMYIPLLAVMPVFQWREPVKGIAWGALFGLLCLPYPVFWLIGNYSDHGSALYPFTYINDFHRTWAATEAGVWGGVWLRIQGLTFWPAMALVTLTPGVFLFGLAGMVVATRTFPATRWLVVAAAVPAAYYALRTMLLVDFVPLARFTVVQVSLLLPFVASGLAALSARYTEATAARWARGALLVAVVMPAALGCYTLFVDHRSADVLESVSPTMTNDRSVMAAAAFVREDVVSRHQTIALDEDATFQDLQLGFYGRVAETGTLRRRWPGFREQFERAPTAYVVLFEHGLLARESWIRLDGTRLIMGEHEYHQAAAFGPAVRVFKR